MFASFSPRRFGWLAAVLSVLLVSACSKPDSTGPNEAPDVGVAQQPLLAGDTWPVEDFVATNSILLRQDTVVTGTVAVVRATPRAGGAADVGGARPAPVGPVLAPALGPLGYIGLALGGGAPRPGTSPSSERRRGRISPKTPS